MEKGWEGMLLADGQRIVYPVNDTKGHHITNEQCWCNPFIQDDVLVHHADDNRPGQRKIN